MRLGHADDGSRRSISAATRSPSSAIRADDSAFGVVLVDYDLDDGKGTQVVDVFRRRGFDGRIVAVSSHARGNAALLAAGADQACPKLRFHEIGKFFRPHAS